MRYKEAENWVFAKLAHELDDVLVYHDIKHTADVVRAADRLCYLEGISQHDTIMVRTAALFHDVGFCEQYMDNEELAAGVAREVLPQFGYTPEEVATIGQMIMATRVPHHPHNKLDEIICDADLDYLGRDDFHPIADNLKIELMHYGIIKTDKEWDEIQVKFFNLHRYFTSSAIKLRQEKKAAHLQEIQSRLSTY